MSHPIASAALQELVSAVLKNADCDGGLPHFLDEISTLWGFATEADPCLHLCCDGVHARTAELAVLQDLVQRNFPSFRAQVTARGDALDIGISVAPSPPGGSVAVAVWADAVCAVLDLVYQNIDLHQHDVVQASHSASRQASALEGMLDWDTELLEVRAQRGSHLGVRRIWLDHPDIRIFAAVLAGVPSLSAAQKSRFLQLYPTISPMYATMLLRQARVTRDAWEHLAMAASGRGRELALRRFHEVTEGPRLPSTNGANPATGPAKVPAVKTVRLNAKATSRSVDAQPSQDALPQLAARMKELVHGQDAAVDTIAAAIVAHRQRLVQRTCLLLSGPTGAGKSHLITVMAQMQDAVVIQANAAALVPAGIAGQTLNDLGAQLWGAAGAVREKAEQAVIFLDEFDKLLANQVLEFGSLVTGQLLRLLEAQTWTIQQRQGGPVTIATGRIIWVLGGAWSAQRDAEGSEAGEPLDLDVLGLPPELRGRVTHHVELRGHTVSSLMTLLRQTSESSPMHCLRRCAEQLGKRLVVPDATLRCIAQRALTRNAGARGLQPLIQTMLASAMWRWHTVEHDTIALAPDDVP